MVDRALADMSRTFKVAYSDRGRPSIPPETLLKALFFQCLYTIRSERELCRRLKTDLLFRWFLDLQPSDDVFDHSVFTHNRERLLDHLERRHGVRPETLGADKGYDAGPFLLELERRWIEPHVAIKAGKIDPTSERADDGTWARWFVRGEQRGAAFRKSQRRRKLVEEFFGWAKTVAGMRRARHVGRQKISQCFDLAAAAYNLVRMKNLLAG